MVYSICHSQPSDQHFLPFSVWSGSSLFAILSSLIRSSLFAILSKQYYHVLKCLPFSGFWSGSTLFFILSNLIRVYTVSYSQQNDQGLHYCHSQSDKGHCHSQQSDQGLHCFLSQQSYQSVHYLPYSAVWSRSKLFAILSSLIKVHTVCLSQQSYQCVHYLPYSAVWSRSKLFAILSSVISVKVYTVILRNSPIRVYTLCHFQQFDQGLYYFSILSKQYYQILQCLPFSAVWSGFTLFVILSSMIRVYTIVIFSKQYY